MAEQPAKLRINLAQREFEVAGSEAFVRDYAERIEALLERLEGDPVSISEQQAVGRGDGAAVQAPRTFGELMHQLPRAATDVDRILAAGHFVQTRSPDNSFSTGEANGLLTEQGIKVGNPSQCVKQNLISKRVFKHQGRYRVSQTGVDYLRQLLGDALPG